MGRGHHPLTVAGSPEADGADLTDMGENWAALADQELGGEPLGSKGLPEDERGGDGPG